MSTVIASDEEGILDHSLVRSKYRESHTPQAFTHRVIRTAYEKVCVGKENDISINSTPHTSGFHTQGYQNCI